MPVSEKDIFASLMQDPNFAYNPLEKVWKEAQQRARQFRNNEKALALAFGDSPALEKLFEFVTKDDDILLSKAIRPDSWEQKLVDKWTADTDANPDWQTNPTPRSLAWYIKALDAEIHTYKHMAPDEEFPEGHIHLNHPDHPENVGTANGVFETEGVDDQGNPIGQDSREGWQDKHTPTQRANLRDNPDYKVRVPEYSRGNFRRATGDTDIWTIADNLANWRDMLKSAQTGIIQGGQNLQEIGAMFAERQGIDNPETWINGFESTIRRLFDDDANISDNVYNTLVAYSSNPKRQEFNNLIKSNRGGYDGPLHDYDRRGENAPPPPEGNRAHEDYADLGDDQRALFHEHMVPEDEMDGMDTREFDRRIQHFTQGLQDYADPAARINHWTSYRPPEDRRPFRLNLNDYKKHVPRKMKSLMPFDEDGNRTPGYDEEEPEALIPTIGEDETPFNAFDIENLNEENIATSILKLVEEYVRMHEGDGSSAHLGPTDPDIEGQVAYFPADEGQTSLQRYQFDKANFTDRHKEQYNKLNTNKAAIEEHLRILFSAVDAPQAQDEDEESWKSRILGADGGVKIKPWTDHLTHEEYQMGGQGRDFSRAVNSIMKLMPPRGAPEGWSYSDENRWYPTDPLTDAPHNEDTYVRFGQTPRPGAYDWYQVLNGVAGIGPEGQAAYVDSNGNPSFHTIPQDFLEGLGYAPAADNLDAFYRQVLTDFDEEEGEQPDYGNWFGLRNADVIARQLIDRAREQAPPEANPWADFTTHVTPGAGDSHRFREAWAKWQADFGPAEGRENPIQTNQLGHFLDWLGYFADSPDVTMTIDGVQHTGKRFTLIPMAYAANPLWHQAEGDEEQDGGGGEDERDEEDEDDDDQTSPFEEEEAEWLREHPDFADMDDDTFNETINTMSEEDVNAYKAAYGEHREAYEMWDGLHDDIKARYDFASWSGLSGEEREQTINDHAAEQAQAEYDDLSENLRTQFTAEEWAGKTPEEKQQAQTRDLRSDKVNYILEYKKLTQHMTDAELEREANNLYDELDDKDFAKEYQNALKLHGRFRENRRKEEEKLEEEGRKPTGKPERTPEDLAKLKADFQRVYEQVYGPLSDDFLDAYSTDYETLDKEYKKALQVQHNNANKEAQGMRKTNANNIVGPDGIDPLPEPPTEDDLIHQVRHIQMWKSHHGPHMTDKEALATLKQLEIEAYQKANNAGIDLEDLNAKDKKEAEEKGISYGSNEWFEEVGKTHIADQQKGARYRRQVQKGGELRSNSNYKPWLVIQYDSNGEGHFLDLRTQQEVRREDLSFDKDNIGFGYSGSGEKPQFDDPESTFWANLDYANLQPIRTDEEGGRSATLPPQIGHSPGRFGHKGTDRAWYHPESKSWINPHRYQDARNELDASTPGSGMLILQGTGYHGTNQSGNRERHYGFQTMGDGVEGLEHSYYIDGQGNIAHVNTDYEHRKVSPDYSQPQTVNSAIHDWHSDHLQQQMKTNMGNWMEGDKPKDSVILSPQQQQGPMPLQNAVKVGDALHRRREQYPQSFTRRKFDKLASDELGQKPTYYGQRKGSQVMPKKGMEKVKQGIMGVVGYTESGVLTGLAKLALNTLNIGSLGILGLGWGAEQNNIRRQRANYNKHSNIQQGVQDHMESVTDNGRQRQYLSPGEEQARMEDHKSLQDDFSKKQAAAQNRAREYKNAGNKEAGAAAEAESIRFQGLKQGIDKRKIENPEDWKHIDSLYRQHYGSPEVQATLAPAIGEQPSRNIADIFQPQVPPQAESQSEIVPNWETSPSQVREIEPNWS